MIVAKSGGGFFIVFFLILTQKYFTHCFWGGGGRRSIGCLPHMPQLRYMLLAGIRLGPSSPRANALTTEKLVRAIVFPIFTKHFRYIQSYREQNNAHLCTHHSAQYIKYYRHGSPLHTASFILLYPQESWGPGPSQKDESFWIFFHLIVLLSFGGSLLSIKTLLGSLHKKIIMPHSSPWSPSWRKTAGCLRSAERH